MSYQYELDCDYQLKTEDVGKFMLINNANKKLILDKLKEHNILMMLFTPNKMQVGIQFIEYDNNTIDVDYYDLYHMILPLLNNYDKLNYTDKQTLANLIYYSKILE